MCVYFCGGTCIEDISAHLMKHLSLHPRLRTCSADTIPRAIEELTCKNITYTSEPGKSYDFNTAGSMNNGFGWDRLPKSFMAQNTVFLLTTAIIRNFHKAILQNIGTEKFGLKTSSHIRAFAFKYVSVPAKRIRMARQDILNMYTDDEAYAHIFKTGFG